MRTWKHLVGTLRASWRLFTLYVGWALILVFFVPWLIGEWADGNA